MSEGRRIDLVSCVPFILVHLAALVGAVLFQLLLALFAETSASR